MSLVETDVELNTGQTKQLEAKIVPEDATNKKVTWESSNETVATVSTTGLVTAKNKGAATITATTEDGNKTTTAQINVVEFKSKTIKFVTQKFYLTNEASNNIQAKVFGDKNNWLKEVEVGYESADDSIISVKEEDSKVSVIGKKVGKTTITATALDGSNIKTMFEIEVLPEFGTTKETALELNHEIESDRARVYTTQKGWVKFKAGDRAEYAVDLGVQSETTGVKGTYYNEEGRQIGNSATWVSRVGTGSSKKAYYEKNDYVYMNLEKTKADNTLYNLSISKDKNGQPDLLKKIELNKSKLYMTKGAQQTIKWSVDKTITYTPTTVISVKDNAVGEMDRNEIAGFENLNTQFIAKNVGKTTIVVEATDGFNKVIEEIEVEVLPDFGTTKETALELNHEIESDRARVYTTQKGWVKFKAGDRAAYAVDLGVQSETTGVKGTYYNEEGRQIGNSATWFNRSGTGSSKKAYYEKNDYVYMYLDKTKADDTLYNLSISKDKNGQPDLLKKIELNKSKLYMTKGAQQTIKWSVDKTITYTPTTVISVKDNAVGEVDRNEITGFENLNTQFIAKNVGKTTIVVEATDGFNKVIEEIEVEVLPDFGTTKETALELNSEIELNKNRVLTTQQGWVKVKVSDTAMYEANLSVQSETTGIKGTYYNEAGQQIGNSATWFSRMSSGKSKKAYYEKGDYMYLYLDKTKADDTHYFISIKKNFTNITPN
nr:Ig-like domain-containing protein [Enterococcus sp. DIV0212c]